MEIPATSVSTSTQPRRFTVSKNQNFWKWILGVVVLTLMFIGTWATTSARLTNAKSSKWTTPLTFTRAAASLPAGTDLVDGVIELDGNIIDAPRRPTPDDWDTLNCSGGNALVKTGVLHDGLGVTIFTGGGSKDPDLLSS